MDRTNKVAFEWKKALERHQQQLYPEEHGWQLNEDGPISGIL